MWWIVFIFVLHVTCNPIVIGHRGAPSYRLEETFASYEIANFQNATFLEIDLCLTKDGYLVKQYKTKIILKKLTFKSRYVDMNVN